jgi:purine-binding chemotaxis protein CheW
MLIPSTSLDFTASIPEVAGPSTLLFRVGGVVYGCDVAETQEIIPLRPLTRLPGAPACVRGLMNVRGTIVTVLDLGVRLDPARSPAQEGSILLVRHRDRLVGVVVEEVLDVRPLELDASRAGEAGSAIVRGIAAVNDDAVVVLDLDAMIKQVLLS